MPLPLPNLDTRRWTDLVDDGRALLFRYAPAWTDYNAHDPGITLLELFAWVAEMDVYRTNRVPPRHVLKFLALLGFYPRPPIAARVPLTFAGSGTVPQGSQFFTAAGIGFRTLRDVTLTTSISSLQVDAGDGTIYDQTSRLGTGSAIEVFGHLPAAGSAVYLGFSQPPNGDLAFYVWLAEAGGGIAELLWEGFTGGPEPWTAIPVTRDGTRTFTNNGEMELSVPAGLAKTALGEIPAPLYYLRCRLLNPSYDTTPLVTGIATNTTLAEQSLPAWGTLRIAPSAAIAGLAPAPGASICLDCTLDSTGGITTLNFLPSNTAGHPEVHVLDYHAPSGGNAGSLTMDLVSAGDSYLLPGAPIVQGSLEVYSHQAGAWRIWTRRNDLDSSARTDFHFVADPTAGTLTFGDGERGRIVPTGALIFARYQTTLAGEGNAGAGYITRSSLPGLTVTNFSHAEGGSAQEDLEGATSRAAAVLYCHDRRSPHAPTNGVDLEDYARMALAVPHTKVARAKAYANLDARYPCLDAPGSITVVIIPAMKIPRPMPSAHLIQAVQAYLDRRRTVCTQVHVTGPTYLEVTVTATVAVVAGTNASAMRQAIVAALNSFLDPLTGGPAGDGWPFGRDVYRADIMQVITQVNGVQYISSMALSSNGGAPNCGNLSICAGTLVSSGTHQITTMTEIDQ